MMHDGEMKYTGEKQKLPSEESHPVTDPLGDETEDSRNPVKKLEKRVLKPNQRQK